MQNSLIVDFLLQLSTQCLMCGFLFCNLLPSHSHMDRKHYLTINVKLQLLDIFLTAMQIYDFKNIIYDRLMLSTNGD